MRMNRPGKKSMQSGPTMRKFAWLWILVLAAAVFPRQAYAAKEDGCTGGAYTVTGAGAPISGVVTTTIAASRFDCDIPCTG